MPKDILVVQKNAAAIEARLAEVNRGAYQHTFTTYEEISSITATSEEWAVDLMGTKKAAIGVVAQQTSGERVANAYSHKRTATEVTLIRKSTGWCLQDAKRVSISGYGGGKLKLSISREQKAIAISFMMARFNCTVAQQAPAVQQIEATHCVT